MSSNALQPEADTRLWYEDKVRRFGFDYRGLGFRTRSSQEKRFAAILETGDLDGKRVLDVGCGFGDFFAFLRERDVQPIYTGLDICAPMIQRCRQRFPREIATFEVGDVLEHEVASPYDYVVASGIFGLDAPGAQERIRPTLERLFRWCRIGVAVNFLSARATTKAERRLYIEPAQALEWGFALTPSARLDHSYLPNDFTLHLKRTPAWLEDAHGESR